MRRYRLRSLLIEIALVSLTFALWRIILLPGQIHGGVIALAGVTALAATGATLGFPLGKTLLGAALAVATPFLIVAFAPLSPLILLLGAIYVATRSDPTTE